MRSCSPFADEQLISRQLVAIGVPTDRPLVGVNFRDASSYHPEFGDQGYDDLAASLDHLIEQNNVHVVFIPITYDPLDDDRNSAASVIDRMKQSRHVTNVTDITDAAELRGLVGRMSLAIGTSYHFLLFALSQHVPFPRPHQKPLLPSQTRGPDEPVRVTNLAFRPYDQTNWSTAAHAG
jgi:hypothetical protein